MSISTPQQPRQDNLQTAFTQARQAQQLWASIPVRERARQLIALREVLVNRSDAIIDLLHRETGKARAEALCTEVLPVLDFLTYFADRAPKLLADRGIPLRLMKHRSSYLNYWPLGVVSVISPWNYPFLLPFADIIMALVAGNAVIFKPSEVTPRSGLAIQDLHDAAGFPQHLLQTLVGDGTLGAAIVEKRPAKIFFTGSVATGKKIMAAASAHLIPVNLELGGKDAMIVLPDADLDYATSAALWGGFSNSGQACASVERVLVHESHLEAFNSQLKEKIQVLKRGSPSASAADQKDSSLSYDLGRIIAEKQKATYQDQLQEARENGALFLTGGDFSEDGTHLLPTLVTGPNIESLAIYREETFGPVVAVTTYKTVPEAIQKVNDSSYGLLASVITRDIALGEDVARRLEVGTVTINEVLYTAGIAETPWGGVKESGIGRTHAEMGLFEFVNVRHIHKPRASFLTFKSLWWFPYTPFQYATFRNFLELYRRSWLDKMKALPHMLWNAVQMLKKEKRL